jgi:hypothetical protein
MSAVFTMSIAFLSRWDSKSFLYDSFKSYLMKENAIGAPWLIFVTKFLISSRRADIITNKTIKLIVHWCY